MKRFLVAAGAVSAIALLASATAANAGQPPVSGFLTFSQYEPGTIPTATWNPTTGVFKISSYVQYTDLITGFTDLGHLTLTGTSTAAGLAAGPLDLQAPVDGSFSLIDVSDDYGYNVLSGTFSNAEFYGSDGGLGVTFSGDTGARSPATISYSSSLFDFGDSPRNSILLGIGSASLNLSGSTIAAFGGQPSGTFSSSDVSEGTPVPSIPEPATWAMMLVGFGAVGGMMRRRRVAAAAA